MRTLHVVTHAEATHHLEDRVGGWFDSSLTEAGARVAGRVARLLRDQIPDAERVQVYSSDLTRAVQTAAPISAALGGPTVQLRGLREISYGEAEGRPQSWLDQRFQPPPALGDRLDHDYGIRGAETRRQFATRVYDAVESILEESGERVVIVTHGFTLTFVVACWIRMPLEASGYMNVRSSSGGITELVEDGLFHNRQISRLNDTAHLVAQ